MLARHLIATDIQAATCGTLRLALLSTTARSSLSNDDENPERAPRRLREWRKPPPIEWSALQVFQRPLPKDNEDSTKRSKPFVLAPIEIKQWWREKIKEYKNHNQRFIRERHEILGCDLAAAHFLVYRGGKVKFLGQDDWIEKESCNLLPTKFDPYWQLTHIDTSGVELRYMGMGNLLNLGRVEWASFKGNSEFDDWCLDKMIAQIPNIEYLDVSQCKLLTDRGLGCLYRLYNLKTLIVTDWEKTPSFELTCVMLEDLNSNLKITVQEPEEDEQREE